MGEKLGIFNFLVATSVFCVINAFVYGWKLSLVQLSFTPIIGVTVAIIGTLQATMPGNELKAYSVAGGAAEEVIAAVRTVLSFGGQFKEVERYGSFHHVVRMT